MQLDKVPADALEELIETLGEKVVKKETDYVYILISQE